MNYCFICGSRTIWQSDFDSEDIGYDMEGITSYYCCCNVEECGAMYEVTKFFDNNVENNYTINLSFQEEYFE